MGEAKVDKEQPLSSKEDGTCWSTGCDVEPLPLLCPMRIVLHIVECLRAFVNHQTEGIGKIGAGAFGVPGGIDDICLCLHLRIAVHRLADDQVRLQLSQLPDEVDHVWSCFLPSSCSFLQVQINAVTSVLLRPLSNLDSHGLCCLPGEEPVPGVRLDGVGIATNGKHGDGAGGHCARQACSTGGSQLMVGRRDLHGVRVDEGEEEDIAGLLPPVKQFRGPVSIAFKPFLRVISQEDVQTQYLPWPPWMHHLYLLICQGGMRCRSRFGS